MSTHQPNKKTLNPGTTEPKVLLEDLAAGLIWPTLLKAPSMAFAPARWLLGILAAFVLVIINALHASIVTPLTSIDTPGATDSYFGIQSTLASMISLDPFRMIYAPINAIEFAIQRAAQDPWSTSLLIVPIIFALGIFGFAITRSASLDFAHNRKIDTASALSAAFLNIRQIALATLGPIACALVLSGLVTLIGLTLGLPVVNLIGALLYIVGLLVTLLIVCIMTMHLLTLPITISALAIEGTDGFDALQRSYAYIVARPLRLAIYTLISLFIGVLTVTVLSTIAGWTVNLTDTLTSALTNDAGRRVLTGDENMGATEPLAYRIIQLSRSSIQLILAGYIMSLAFCSTTLIYLCTRRICDGQDITEIWDPDQ